MAFAGTELLEVAPASPVNIVGFGGGKIFAARGPETSYSALSFTLRSTTTGVSLLYSGPAFPVEQFTIAPGWDYLASEDVFVVGGHSVSGGVWPNTQYTLPMGVPLGVAHTRHPPLQPRW